MNRSIIFSPQGQVWGQPQYTQPVPVVIQPQIPLHTQYIITQQQLQAQQAQAYIDRQAYLQKEKEQQAKQLALRQLQQKKDAEKDLLLQIEIEENLQKQNRIQKIIDDLNNDKVEEVDSKFKRSTQNGFQEVESKLRRSAQKGFLPLPLPQLQPVPQPKPVPSTYEKQQTNQSYLLEYDRLINEQSKINLKQQILDEDQQQLNKQYYQLMQLMGIKSADCQPINKMPRAVIKQNILDITPNNNKSRTQSSQAPIPQDDIQPQNDSKIENLKFLYEESKKLYKELPNQEQFDKNDYLFDGEADHNGQKCGFGSLRNKDGFIIYQGKWLNDQYHGQGTLFNEEIVILKNKFDYTDFTFIDTCWTKYEGEFQYGSMSGFGCLELSNGEKLLGKFLNGKVHGEAEFHDLRYRCIKGIWKEDKLIQLL